MQNKKKTNKKRHGKEGANPFFYSLYLYKKLVSISIKSQLQYKISFILQGIGHFFVTGIEFLGIWALFDRFQTLKGWTLYEVSVFYGLINMGFAISDALSKGFDYMGQLIRRGEFDRFLIRPVSPILLLFGYEFTMRRVGRLLQGIAVFIFGIVNLRLHFSLLFFISVSWILGGIILFFTALFIFQAALSFKSVESLEIINIFTYGGVEVSQYPMAIYKPGFLKFFTYFIPLACVSYYPINSLLTEIQGTGSYFSAVFLFPLSGLFFYYMAILTWKHGLRWYSSSGS